MSELSSQSQPATMSPEVKRQALLFETFMTHCTLMALAMVVVAFAEFGVSGFALGSTIFFGISLGLQRLAVLAAKPLTLGDRSQVSLGARLLVTIAGLLIPPLCMAIVLSQG